MVLSSSRSFLLAFVFLAFSASSMALDAVLPLESIAGTSTNTSNTTDHLALISFKSLMRRDPSQALASWGNRSVPMCRWHGVACGLRGSRRGRVVALNLAELNLLGTITAALGNLTYLKRLNLSSNHLHGVLPPELGNLHNLEVLSLDKNMLTGRIHSSIGSLVILKVLSLDFNSMIGQIPTEIGSLINLVTLSLDSNNLSGVIPSSVGNLSALAVLNVYNNSLEGSIPPLQGLSSLNYLELGQNRLQGYIPSWLGNLTSLEVIDLQGNGLVGQIPESLGNLRMLQILSLSTNNLSGPIPHEIGIGNLHALTELYIDTNQLEGSLPPMLNFSSLEILNIQYNKFVGVLPPNMGNTLPQLQQCLLAFNQFQGMLPSSLCNTSMLEIIQIEENFLSGTIPQCLGTHQNNLASVSLGGNQLEASNDADWGFVTSLANCSNLNQLELGANKLHGVLPNSIGNLSAQLEYLGIRDNFITGTIPETIGNLIGLGELYIQDNVLEGTIPASLSKLNKLNKLYLSNNNLSGRIPASLGNLTQLTILDLSTNAIAGPIPSSLSSCPLDSLDLSHNNLSGPTPIELFFVSTLTSFMRLSHNSLSGTIPSEVGNLKNLGELDFSNNMISGEIPTSIGECQSLEHLNASVNLLQGAIPSSVGNLKGLLVLDLSYNNLSGTIPEILGGLTGLSSLNLSFNKFQGGVPTHGIFLNASATLVRGNDDLCGGIPQLNLPPCSSHTTKKMHQKLAVIVSLCSGFVFVTLAFALYTSYQRRQKTKLKLQRPVVSEQYIRVSYAELVSATNGFAFENLIGEGSFGSVYKGRMRSNDQDVVVAVKVLNLKQRGASQSFAAECETLRCTRHRNLVKILTVCSSIDFQGRDFKALVYEFLSNGNLDQRLHQNIMEDGEENALDIIARLSVAIDVASSLDYLHQHKPIPIVHCDLKPSNVLLDSDMVAHVSDFGLARFLHEDSEKSSGWASMRGSIGYVAPEYGLGNEVSTSGDVYSYGILLLEMFTGKRPTASEFGEAMGLRGYVRTALPDRVSIIVDQQLLTETKGGQEGTSNSGCIRDMRIACAASVLQVGIWCSEEAPVDRPPIGDALKEMQAIREKFHLHLSGGGVPSIPEALGPFMA